MTAKRVKTTTVKEELPEEITENTVDMSGDLGNLGLVLQQFPEPTLMVEVYKDESGHMEYCETIRGSHQIEKDTIRDTWGGGKFELKIYDNGQLEGTVVFRVAKRATPLNNPVMPNLDSQNQFLQKMVLTMLQNRPQESLSLKDVIGLIKPESPEKILEVLLKGMELGKNGGAAADWKSELIHTVKDLGTSIIPGVMQLAANQNAHANGTTPVTVVPDAILSQGIAAMKQKVLAGLPVGLALDWIIANARDYEPLLKAIMESGYEKFVTIDPELNNEPFKTWFTALHTGIKEIYASHTNDADSDGTTGDS
jgi:hypothetical protein